MVLTSNVELTQIFLTQRLLSIDLTDAN